MPGHQKRAAHVDGEHVVPLLFADVIEVRGLKKTSIIDQNIDLPALLVDGSKCCCNALSITDVTFHSDCLPAFLFYFSQGSAGFIR